MNSYLLIKKCSHPLRWYSNLIGEKVINLGYVGNNEYRSREPAGYINFVLKEDCEVIYE